MEIHTFISIATFLCLRGARNRSDFRPAVEIRNRKNRTISVHSTVFLRSLGDMKNQGEKKTKKQKTTKCQNMKSTPLLGGHLSCFEGIFAVEVGIFLSFLTQTYPPEGLEP